MLFANKGCSLLIPCFDSDATCLLCRLQVRRAEVREQAQIALGASQRMNCTVCFARGQERQAYFAVEGLPAHVKAGLAPGASQGAGWDGFGRRCVSSAVVPGSVLPDQALHRSVLTGGILALDCLADLSLLKPSVLQQVASAAPVCLVADPGTQPQTGLVLSVAPLMGAAAAVDARHARWLHVQVREGWPAQAWALDLQWQAACCGTGLAGLP